MKKIIHTLGFHDWGKWSEPIPAKVSYPILGKFNEPTTAQVRYCKICNKEEIR